MTPYKFLAYGVVLVVGVWVLLYVLQTIFWMLTYQESKRWILETINGGHLVQKKVPLFLKHLWKLRFAATGATSGEYLIEHGGETFTVVFRRHILNVRGTVYEIDVRDSFGFTIYEAQAPQDWNAAEQTFTETPVSEERYPTFVRALQNHVHDMVNQLQAS